MNESSIVIGHSLGPVFLLHIIEKLHLKIKAAFFVAKFVGSLDNDDFDNLNKTFVNADFDWMKIKKNCDNFVIINSDNDPYVSIEKGSDLAEKLGAEMIIIKNGGHLNKESGYGKFEFLLNQRKSELEYT